MGRTDFLFAMPSYWGGFAAGFDLGGTLVEFNDSASGAQADARALRSDWSALGDDFRATLAEAAMNGEKAQK
jgi:hypothetical protein